MFVKQAFDLLWRSFRAEGNNWDPGALNCSDKLPTFHFPLYRRCIFRDGGSQTCLNRAAEGDLGQHLVLAQVPQKAFWGQGQPPSSLSLPTLASLHTQGRDPAEHPLSSQGMCRDFVHCQSRRWQIWHKGCQCLHSKVTKICLWECLPSFSRVFSGENVFLTWAGTFQELETSVSALQWECNHFLLFKSVILQDLHSN